MVKTWEDFNGKATQMSSYALFYWETTYMTKQISWTSLDRQIQLGQMHNIARVGAFFLRGN